MSIERLEELRADVEEVLPQYFLDLAGDEEGGAPHDEFIIRLICVVREIDPRHQWAVGRPFSFDLISAERYPTRHQSSKLFGSITLRKDELSGYAYIPAQRMAALATTITGRAPISVTFMPARWGHAFLAYFAVGDVSTGRHHPRRGRPSAASVRVDAEEGGRSG